MSHVFLFQYRLGVGLKLLGNTRVIFPGFTKLCDFLKILRDNKHNRPNLAREYARICSVLVHYLFLEAHSFPSSFRLRKMFALNIQVQRLEDIFAQNEGYCLCLTELSF